MKESFGDIINGDVPTLVDFSAVWCGPCKMMEPILKELNGIFGDRLRILKVDVDKNPQLSQSYNITGVPTLILFKNGTVAWRQSGVVPAKQLAQLLQGKISA